MAELNSKEQAERRYLRCGKYLLDLTRPQIMGIVNVTPDSFCSQGRYYQQKEAAVRHAVSLVEAGATIIDIGGESTRPNAKPVSLQEELDRVIPVIEKLRVTIDVPISVDTSQPVVMQAAVDAGANVINDVRALRMPGALTTAAKLAVPVCLMHMRYMAQDPISSSGNSIETILDEVKCFLHERMVACLEAGIAKEHLILDPGFGGGAFGKTMEENMYLLARLPELKLLGLPILVGVSRKSFLGELLKKTIEERISASVIAAMIAVQKGADIVRVHDVAETREALQFVVAVNEITNKIQ